MNHVVLECTMEPTTKCRLKYKNSYSLIPVTNYFVT